MDFVVLGGCDWIWAAANNEGGAGVRKPQIAELETEIIYLTSILFTLVADTEDALVRQFRDDNIANGASLLVVDIESCNGLFVVKQQARGDGKMEGEEVCIPVFNELGRHSTVVI